VHLLCILCASCVHLVCILCASSGRPYCTHSHICYVCDAETTIKFYIKYLRIKCYVLNISIKHKIWYVLIWRHAVAQLVEALCYKPEGRGVDSRCSHWNFSLTYSFRPHCGPGVDSASNRNECQEYFLGGKGSRCVKLTILILSCAFWGLNPWNHIGLSRPLMGLLYLYLYLNLLPVKKRLLPPHLRR
jgi:hypothetical protein